MWTAAIFSVIVAVSAGLILPPDNLPGTCAATTCRQGERCVLQEVNCVRAPCFPQPVCVKDQRLCPQPGLHEVGICANTCEADSHCPGDGKCCRNACGATTCQAPVRPTPLPVKPSCDTVKCGAGKKCVMKDVWCFRAPCPKTLPRCVPSGEKAGVCPRPAFSLASFFCLSQCQVDSQCPGARKCCRTRCGARCLVPKPPPSLTCATVDCRPGFECVMKRWCKEPDCSPTPICEPVKRCPFYPAWINPHCVRRDTCSEQGADNCPSGTICCATDCGRRCVRPLE